MLKTNVLLRTKGFPKKSAITAECGNSERLKLNLGLFDEVLSVRMDKYSLCREKRNDFQVVSNVQYECINAEFMGYEIRKYVQFFKKNSLKY